ncbi:MAG: cupin domain-containing protein [FCB group bacterium]|jgi:uncharacterized cupin superfamily protein
MNIIVKKLSDPEIKNMGIEKWQVWTKEISKFDWFYDSQEMCLILEGEAIIKSDFEEVTIKKGDYVLFPVGLKCTWNITSPIKKYYNFK